MLDFTGKNYYRPLTFYCLLVSYLMAYEPLHHKYRPQTFKDLVGQEAIANTLLEAIKLAKIAPAYLFTGPRGTGKTSSARILAKSLNCLNYSNPTVTPCGKCEVCRAIASGNALDVIEIDAASNTGVDNIREIIERSRFAPVQCRYKVYAIDECHMLSTAAFNALLKTLEEPPPQVVFILATTDPQRVLSTIISRCQRFDYRRIRLEAMVSHLEYIAQQENIDITTEALTLTAQIANGGLRDAESLLDQLSLFPEQITVDKIWDLVGAVPERDLLALLKAIRERNIEDIVMQCRNLLDRGREPLVLLQNLAGFYLNLLIAKTSPHRQDLVAVTETCWQQLCEEARYWQLETILQGQQQLKEGEVQIKNTTQPRLWLEVTLLGLLERNTAKELPQQAQTIGEEKLSANSQQDRHHSKTENVVAKAINDVESTTPVKELTKEEISTATIEPSIAQTQAQPSPSDRTSLNGATQSTTASIEATAIVWQQVIKAINRPMTQALLRQQCELIDLNDTSAIVGMSSASLRKKYQGEVPNIEAAFAKVCQRPIKVILEVVERQSHTARTTTIERSQHTTATVINSPKPPTTKPQNERSERSQKPLIESSEATSIQQKQILQTNSVVVTETKVQSTSNRDTAADSEDSEGERDFVKAVELVAQKFDGEVIEFSDSSARVIPSTKEIAKIETTLEQQKVVIKRDAIAYDEDDIPFMRPIYSGIISKELWDAWELSVNSYWKDEFF